MASKKRMKNVPVLHNEVKERHQIVVTPTAWTSMKKEAVRRGISISELIEVFARGIKSPRAYPPELNSGDKLS